MFTAKPSTYALLLATWMILLAAAPALALSPRFVEIEFTLGFERGAIALSAANREKFLNQVSRALSHDGLCQTSYFIFVTGDSGESRKADKSLTIDRERYLKDLGERHNLPTPIVVDQPIFVGQERTSTAQIYFFSYQKPYGCN